jgi:NAD(P)-dependent dehydrogenase (short-subunit alcohol dehydrogenase family)
VGGAIGDATTINLEAWERDFRINVTSMVMMSRFAIPEMRKQGRGSIINMSSVSGCKSKHPFLNRVGPTNNELQYLVAIRAYYTQQLRVLSFR